MASQWSKEDERAVRDAFSKKKSLRTAADWEVIYRKQVELTKVVLADGASYLKLLEAATSDFDEAVALIREYRQMYAAARRLLADHPAAAELRRRDADLSAKLTQIAKKPRKRTKQLRADAPILRVNFEAAKKEGKARGWKKRTALEYRCSTKTLNKIVFQPQKKTNEK